MAISCAQVRAAVAAQVATVSGFRESRFPPQYFGRMQNTIANKAYTVQIGTILAGDDRQRRTVGEYLQTAIIIRFASRLRPHDCYPTDYDSSFDLLQQIIAAVIGDYASIRQGLSVRFLSASHSIPESIEWIIHEIQLSAFHTIN